MAFTCNLEHFISMHPKWAAIVNSDHIIMHCNTSFASRFNIDFGSPLYSTIQDDTGRFYATYEKARAAVAYSHLEVALPSPHGPNPTWCDFYPMQNGLCILIMHSTRYTREIELAYMHRVRRYTDDNLWVVDNDGCVIWCMVGANDSRAETALGNQYTELFADADKATVGTAMQHAQKNQGHTITVLAHPAGLQRQAEIDIVNMPLGAYGARFFIASRLAQPRGTGIVDRIMEAYQVKTYTSLAEKMHITKSSISRAAQGNAAPADLIVKCHNDTGVSLDWLVSGKGQKELWLKDV